MISRFTRCFIHNSFLSHTGCRSRDLLDYILRLSSASISISPVRRSTIENPLSKTRQIRSGLHYSWKAQLAASHKNDGISNPLKNITRTETDRRRVEGWRPIVQKIGDQRLRIAIVGRMNSGKSSLFNVLCHSLLVPNRQNSVKDFEGITRDCVEGIANFDTSSDAFSTLCATIIDTPGVIDGDIVEEALTALATADMILFMTAVDQLPTDEDHRLRRYLLSHNLPVVLVVNKVDLIPSDACANVLSIFEGLGLGKPIPLSTRFHRGIELLVAAILPFCHIRAMHATEEAWSLEDLAMSGDSRAMEEIRTRNNMERSIRIAIVGRTNSGKSTLINRLLGYERNRASPEVNTTRDAVEISCLYRGKRLQLIDTAGLTRKHFLEDRPFLAQMNAKTINEIRFSHVCIVCVDATEGNPNKYDMSLLHRIALEGRPFVLCANKWDAVLDPSGTAEAFDFKIKRQIREVKYSSAVVVSAHSGLNLELLLDHTLQLHEKWNKQLRSNELTRFWRRMEKSLIIPHHVSRIGRIKQVNIRPPTFLLYLQTKDQGNLLSRALEEMIKNAITEEFDFKGVPLRLIQEVKDPNPDYI